MGNWSGIRNARKAQTVGQTANGHRNLSDKKKPVKFSDVETVKFRTGSARERDAVLVWCELIRGFHDRLSSPRAQTVLLEE